MSLINDALKRAKQAQRPAPPPGSVLQFRPVEPGQHARRRYDWVVPAVVAVVGILAFIFIWSWARKDATSKSAQTAPQAVVAAKEIFASDATTSQPASAPQPATTAAPATVPNGAPPPATDANAPTNAAASEPPAPKPPPLRLQAIVCSPTRPSAMINGKTLWLGDKLGAFRVVAIDHESATLVGLGQTNVLVLDQ